VGGDEGLVCVGAFPVADVGFVDGGDVGEVDLAGCSFGTEEPAGAADFEFLEEGVGLFVSVFEAGLEVSFDAGTEEGFVCFFTDPVGVVFEEFEGSPGAEVFAPVEGAAGSGFRV